MRCDLNCPYGDPYCCRGCCRSRKYLKDKYPTKWTDRFGFWCITGCRLGEDRPQECKDYDCKDYIFYSTTGYVDGEWKTVGLHEVHKDKRDKKFVEEYNDVFRKVKDGS